jgi:peptide/nickel transport system substrate-binding protein
MKISKFCAAAVVLTLAACNGSSTDTGIAEAPAPASSAPRYGGSIVIARPIGPNTLNPLYVDTVPSVHIASLVHASLMRLTDRLEYEPELAAAEPEISVDGKVVTVTLRDGVRFHDGMPLTAHDVVFTYRTALDESYSGEYTEVRLNIASVDALDERTVRFAFVEPYAPFRGIFTIGIAPRHLLEQIPGVELRDYRAYNVERPIGAGPFKLASWAPGQNVVLERFDEYFEGRPYLDRVTFRFANPSAAVLLLQTGEVDQIMVDLADVASVDTIADVALQDTWRDGYELIAWNVRNPLFADRRVRQALTHAIDRETMVAALFGDRGVVAHIPMSPTRAAAYTNDVPKYAYDPASARALLAEAGWSPGPDGVQQKDGQRFAFELLTNSEAPLFADVAVIVQQQLREIGVEVSVATLELRAMFARINPPRSEFDALVTAHGSGDLYIADVFHSRAIEQGNNVTGFSHGRVDELIDRSLRAMNRDQHREVIDELMRVLAEELPVTFLFYRENLVALRSDIRGFRVHPMNMPYRAHEWWRDGTVSER